MRRSGSAAAGNGSASARGRILEVAIGTGRNLPHYPAEDPSTRTRWRSLADAAGAQFRVIVCTCSDRELHQARLEGRTRGIPGWHEGGSWANVERRLAEFPPWTGEVLTIDAVQPLEQNLATVLQYVTS